MYKLAIVASHPIQYQSPLWKFLAADSRLHQALGVSPHQLLEARGAEDGVEDEGREEAEEKEEGRTHGGDSSAELERRTNVRRSTFRQRTPARSSSI